MKSNFGFIFLFLAGCGTGTGNPELTPPSNNNGAGFSFLLPVCSKIVSCHSPLSMQTCESSIQLETNFGSRLGLGASNKETLAEITTKTNQNIYKLDRSAYEACMTEVNALTCDSNAVTNAYLEGASNPFLRAAEILSSTCQNVVRP